MKRWNPATRAWDIDYRPGKGQYPPLPVEIQKQLKMVELTHDGMMEYFPCAVTLGTGEICECVYFANAESYIKVWGVWPEDDPEKRTLRLEDVTLILPVRSVCRCNLHERCMRLVNQEWAAAFSHWVSGMVQNKATPQVISSIFWRCPMAKC
jgi:hypothetical protein